MLGKISQNIQFVKRGLYRLAARPLPAPHFAQIEITNICNLNCSKCVRRYISGLTYDHMEFDTLKKIVGKLTGVHTIGLTGFGEPLAYPKIFEAIELCKERGFEVQFTTNGLLLNNDRIRRLIGSGLDNITFSVDSVSGTHPMHQNAKAFPLIDRLIEQKKVSGSRTPRITLQAVLVRGFEKDLFEVIEWGAQRDIFRVNVSRLNLNTADKTERLSVAEEKKIFEKFSCYRKENNMRIDCVQDQFYSGIKGQLYRYLRPFLRLENHCPRLEDFIYFDIEGNVRPCCALAKHKMGNILTTPLEEIWFGKKYKGFRKHYKNILWCKKCDILTVKQSEFQLKAK